MHWEASLRIGVLVSTLGFCIGCADEDWPSPKSSGRGVTDSGISGDISAPGDTSVPDGRGADVGIADAESDLRDSGAISDLSVTTDAAIPDVLTRVDADAGETSKPVDMSCSTSRSAEPIPARTVATSSSAADAFEEIYVSTGVFNPFFNACGGCHVDANFGGLKVSLPDFRPDSPKVGQPMVDRMTSDDPKLVMPPPTNGGTINSERKPGDPVIQLIARFKQWIAAGRPTDVFKIPRPLPPPDDASRYVMTPERGKAMTNIGDCIPSAGLVGSTAPPTRAEKLDAMFAALKAAPPGSGAPLPERIGLPERLADTDLYTLNTAALAQDRVLPYAPTYPLWSDSARKIRYIRVPLNQSIRFDKQTQTFTIPPNTRFYKTFLKPVIEKGGSLRYRKVETRLIVARPDKQGTDGKGEFTALFGAYKWDDAEKEAVLVTETLNNLEPFKDQLLTLVTDEDKAEAVRASTPPGENIATALEQARATRKYAIPGKERCIQCHMGSPTRNFVLGFFPLQVHRRPAGEGGVIEPAGPDELTQLERFISYGVITGIDSPADITPLEASQGTRKPRNDYELTAQGYVLGNCAHCHNPRGFPSVENPVLRDIFNFLPDAEPVVATEGCRKQGGLFQFPLGCTSPRILRGPSADILIPYITPSLVDYPILDDRVPTFPAKSEVPAPWRSLIYRNVDTPFIYEDDAAIFPHMPVNTPGFDCRAPRIIGEWMVSIPAVRLLKPDVDETKVVDPAPQPYKEVAPSDPNYARAVTQATARLSTYQWGFSDAWREMRISRHAFCPDTSNIQDPFVTLEDQAHLVPPDENVIGPDGKLIMPTVGTPRRAHWIVTDLTQPRVEGWLPRRDDWAKVLVHDCLCNEKKAECKKVDGRIDSTFACPNSDPAIARKLAQLRVIGILKGTTGGSGIRVTEDFKSFAREKIPFGLWAQRPDCSYSSQRTVGSYPSSTRPKWMGVAAAPESAAVYETTPGGAVFGMICINCHGAQADSRGRMADTVLTMTGGSTRVANLRDGFFGALGANRTAVFGAVANADASADDWGARYMAWMALGGTTKVLPLPVLRVVGNTSVLGVKRKGAVSVATDGNMLETAKHLCRFILPNQDVGPFNPTTSSFDYAHVSVPPIATNGDLELWQRICTLGNSAPVRTLLFSPEGNGQYKVNPLGIMRSAQYGANPVGNHLGKIQSGVQADNVFPWCWNARSEDVVVAEKYANDHPIDGLPLPKCPAGYGIADSDENRLNPEEIEAWLERGAINAGLSVFVYLDDLTRGKTQAPRSYNECPAAAAP